MTGWVKCGVAWGRTSNKPACAEKVPRAGAKETKMKTSQFLLESAKSPAEVKAGLTGFFTEMQSGVADLIAQLPEQFRPQFVALKAKADQVLTNLAAQPTEQVPAAQEMNWGLRSMAYALMSFREQYEAAQGLMQDLVKKYAGMQTELQSLTPLKAQKEAGELMSKEDAQKQADAAVKEAVERVTGKFQLLGARRTELQSLGLPAAPDEVLNVDDKAFGELRKTGQERFRKLTDLGVASELNSADAAALVYGPASEFDRVVKIAGRGRSAGSASEGRRAEPLLGASGSGSGSAGGDGNKVAVRRGF